MFGKQQRTPLKTKNIKSILSEQGTLKAKKLEPGDLIFQISLNQGYQEECLVIKDHIFLNKNIEVVPSFVMQPVDLSLLKVNLH